MLLKWSLFFRFCYQNVTWISHVPCANCRFSPPFHPGFDHCNNIWWVYANNKLFITELSHFFLLHMSWVQKFLSAFLKHFQALNHRNEIWPFTLLLGFPNWLSTCCRLDVSGFKPHCRQELFTSPLHPQQSWGPPGHLYNEYWRYFSGVKGLGHGVDQPHLSSAEDNNEYYYTSSPPIMGWP